jgi:hypothetical protein
MYTYINVKTSPLARMVTYKTGAEGGKKTTQSSSYRVLANRRNSLHVLLTANHTHCEKKTNLFYYGAVKNRPNIQMHALNQKKNIFNYLYVGMDMKRSPTLF